MMTPQEFTLCKEVIQYLSSAELNDKNYLFLEPVDLQLFNTYLQYVQKPMDLGTVATLLASSPSISTYKSLDEFFADVTHCFDNAVRFHSDKPANKWIVKLAKDMIRITQREQKKILKKLEGNAPETKPTQAMEDGEIVSDDLNVQGVRKNVSDGRGKTISVVKANKTQRQAKFKLTLPLTKNAPQPVKSETSRGKQMMETSLETAASAAVGASKNTATQQPPKIRLSLGTAQGKKLLASSMNQNVNTMSSSAVQGSDSDRNTSILESVGRPHNNHLHTLKNKKLPMQNKSTDSSLDTTAQAFATTNFSSGLIISNVDALFDSVVVGVTTTTMTRDNREQCYKVLNGVIRRNSTNANWFLKPVNDPRLVDDYKAKIPYPMDLGTIGQKLDKNQYNTVADFVLDVRRVFSNCLRYNSEAVNPLRHIAREMLISAEALMIVFLNLEEFPRLLHCWRKIIDAIDEILTLTTSDGHLIAHYFLHPPSYYFGGACPSDYLEKISNPIDLGTITSKLFECSYESVDDVIRDVQLIPANCTLYNKDTLGTERGNSLIMISHSQKIGQILLGKLQSLISIERCMSNPKNQVEIKKPPKSILIAVMKELRATSFMDKFTKLSEPATLQFEEPVDTSIFTDYLQYVEVPMDLSQIDRKIEADKYCTPEDFEYDIMLVFKNCETYNVPKKNTHIVALARHCIKTFKKIFQNLVNGWEMGLAKRAVDSETIENASRYVESTTGPWSKKIKIDQGQSSIGLKKSLVQAQVTTTASAVVSSQGLINNKITAPVRENVPRIIIKLDGPIPLHVAIAQIKDSFSCRRMHKDLEAWEGACSRFFQNMLRHPWLSALRPKFIFSCPVPILYPELKEAYAAKIVKPMDLTTIECKLLQGGIYKSPQELIDDVALVFSNAVTFNKEGYEAGELLSWAYYDASRHLLRYCRWLSLDSFESYLTDDLHDEGAKQIGPIPSWKLRKSYWKDAKEEMEEIVYNQPIDISDDGDRFTWMETECEKLLKCLRHQSDYKKMEFFLDSIFPVDYFAFISRPMDWKTCERTLQQRKYKYFGDIIKDLRLIFSNALTYNGPAKGTDTVSGRAYDAAVFMSNKLEAYISKMILTLSERILRERIDDTIFKREKQAAEKAEATRLRNEWQQQRERTGSIDMDIRPAVNKITENKVSTIHIKSMDFPHNEDEPPNQDLTQQESASQHRLLLEKQLEDRQRMQNITINIGNAVYRSLLERSKAISWAESLANSCMDAEVRTDSDPPTVSSLPSSECDILVKDRKKIKIVIAAKAEFKKSCKIRLFDD